MPAARSFPQATHNSVLSRFGLLALCLGFVPNALARPSVRPTVSEEWRVFSDADGPARYLTAAPPLAGQDLVVDPGFISSTPTGGIPDNRGPSYTLGSDQTYNYAYVGLNDVGIMTQTGGTLTLSGVLYVGYNLNSNGTYNFNGGTLATNGVIGNIGVGTFHFNGGTLRAVADSGVFVFGSRLTADVRNGGASVDTAGHSVTISQNLLHSTVSGDNATDGGLTKTGAGTLTLSGANTYTGNTTVSAGTLNLANTLALQNSTLAPGGGAVTFASSVTANAFTLGGLSGSGNLALANNAATPAAVALSVGGNNASTTYSGNLSGPGSLTKLGTGTLALTGTNTYTGDTTVNAGTLAIARGAIVPTTLTVSGTGTGTAAATLNLSSGGYLSTSSAAIGTFASNGQAGQTGVFNQTGGIFTTNGGTLNVGIGISTDGNSFSYNTGTYTLSAGNLSTGAANIGNEGGSGTFIQTGGDFTTNGNQFALSNASNSASSNASGTYTLGGGTLTTGTALFGRSFFGFSGSSTFNLNGGTFTPTQIVSGGGTSTFHFNGGTLRAGASDNPGAATNPSTFFNGLTTADVRNGGAVIDTNGFNVTVAQSLVHSTVVGDAAIDGGLIKQGAGTLTLTGNNNSYTGPTQVRAGVLAVNGTSTGSGMLSVASGATLTGAGSIAGAVQVQTGGTFSPGQAGTGTLTLGSNLMLNGAATAAFTLSGTAVLNQSTRAQVGGSISLNGATLQLTLASGFTLQVGQTFYLLDRTGTDVSPTGTFANAPAGIYTDGTGNTYLVNYLANDPANGSLLANDVSVQVLSVVPEPSTWVLLAAGGGLLGLAVLRRGIA